LNSSRGGDEQMNLVQIGTNAFFPQLIRLAANERHLQSRPYSNQKLGRRDQNAASSELFLAFTPRSFPTGTRDGAAENHASHNLAVLRKGMFAVILQRWEYRGTFRNPRPEAQMRAPLVVMSSPL
jgi:hypothetical protein